VRKGEITIPPLPLAPSQFDTLEKIVPASLRTDPNEVTHEIKAQCAFLFHVLQNTKTLHATSCRIELKSKKNNNTKRDLVSESLAILLPGKVFSRRASVWGAFVRGYI